MKLKVTKTPSPWFWMVFVCLLWRGSLIEASGQGFLLFAKSFDYRQDDAGLPSFDFDDLNPSRAYVTFIYQGKEFENERLQWGSFLAPSGITFALPAEPRLPIADFEIGGRHRYDLEQKLPAGDYQFVLPKVGGGSFSESLSVAAIPAASLPSVPRISNHEDLQFFDPAKPLEVRWDPVLNSDTAGFFILFEAEHLESGRTFSLGLGDLASDAASVTIPENTFEPEDQIFVEMSVGLLLAGDLDSDRLVAFQKNLNFRMQAAPKVGTDTTKPRVLSHSPDDLEDISPRSVVRIEFSEPMADSIAMDWGSLIDPTKIRYSWNAKRTVLYCRHVGGFPPNDSASYWVNAPELDRRFTDLAGNEAVGNEAVYTTGFFSTSSVGPGVPDAQLVALITGTKFVVGGQSGEVEAFGESFLRILARGQGIDSLYEGSVRTPTGSVWNMSRDDTGRKLQAMGHFSDASDGAAFVHPGEYDVRFTGSRDGERSVAIAADAASFEVPPVAQPVAVPTVLSPAGGSISWQRVDEATEEDWIQLTLLDHAGAVVHASPDLGEPGALDGTDTSLAIPGNCLRPGRSYTAEILVARALRSTSVSYPGVPALIMRASVLRFAVQTTGTPHLAKIVARPGSFGDRSVKLEISGESKITMVLETSDNLVEWLTYDSFFLDDTDDLREFGFRSSSPFEFYRINEGGTAPLE